MTPAAIIEKAKAEGVTLALTPVGKVKLRGPEHLVARWLPVIRDHRAGIVAALGGHRATHAEVMESIQEGIEERAAIMEHEAGLPREQAEAQAMAAMFVYEYRLTDGPRWLPLLAPGRDLANVERSLRDRFGTRLVALRKWKP